MVTGDNKITAANIAGQVGINEDGKGRIVEASEFIKELEAKGLLRESSDPNTEGSNKIKKVVMETPSD